MTQRVLVREAIAPAGVELLRKLFDVDVDSDSDLAEIIDRYDAIVIRSATKLTADLIGRASHLKVIGRAGVGVDNVDVDAATRRGIIVANAPESTVVSAAEHTVGLLVALARNIPQAHAALKQGRWERKAYGGNDPCAVTFLRLQFLGKVLIAENLRDVLWSLELLARHEQVDANPARGVKLPKRSPRRTVRSPLPPRWVSNLHPLAASNLLNS